VTKAADSLYRPEAAALIRKTIAECGSSNENAVRLALRKAYPRYIPLGLWLDEIDSALGKKKPAAVQPGPKQEGLW
jgi:hypothetical protein